jgi:polyhydroxyalkanoate synthesis regulator phasin
MKQRLFALITRARQDLELAEKIARAEVSSMGDEDAVTDLHEARARVLALEARVAAIEERSQE